MLKTAFRRAGGGNSPPLLKKRFISAVANFVQRVFNRRAAPHTPRGHSAGALQISHEALLKPGFHAPPIHSRQVRFLRGRCSCLARALTTPPSRSPPAQPGQANRQAAPDIDPLDRAPAGNVSFTTSPPEVADVNSRSPGPAHRALPVTLKTRAPPLQGARHLPHNTERRAFPPAKSLQRITAAYWTCTRKPRVLALW